MSSSEGFWHGRKVLVTGHTGFKGAWLSHWLLRAGSDVVGYSLPAPTEPSLFDLTRLCEHVEHHEGDVRDLEALRHCVGSVEPEIVFHMAAQTLVLESYRDPVGTFDTNVMGAVNLLQVLRSSTALRACVVVTSDKCYENRESGRAYREGDPLGGSDPYSASKGCAELVTAAFRRSFFGELSARVASARAGNVIGGGDWAHDRIVPDIVRALTGKTALELRRPDAVRPWQHVLEPISGYIRLAEDLVERPDLEDEWNFGPDHQETWRVRDVVSAFMEAWGQVASTDIRLVSSPFPEATFLALDSSRARSRLGWAPRWNVEDAIFRTVQWYHAFYREEKDAQALVHADLEAYDAAAPSRQADSLERSGA